MKKILVPTDFSEQATFALEVAAQLAKKNDSEIIMLHLLEFPEDMVDPLTGSANAAGPGAIIMMKNTRKKFIEFRKKEFLQGLTVTETVLGHKAFEGIMDVSKKEQVDLIVMGSRGTSDEIMVGSNTEKVVRTSEIPVLVVKERTDVFATKDFVFASSFDDECKETFANALDFAQKLKATVHLVTINTPQKFSDTASLNKKMENFISNFDVDDYTLNVYNDYNIAKGIINFAKFIDADLIGMGTHGRKGISHFFNGSRGEDVVNHATLPVVTFKIK